MTKVMIAFAASMSLLSFAGCKKKGGSDDSMAKMESFQKQMCECTDKPCADKVQAEMTKWSDAAKTMKTDDKPDPEMTKKSGEVMAKYSDCMTKAMGMSGDMKGGDMKGAGDMKGGADMKGGSEMSGGDMKGGSDMKGGDMKGADMKGGSDMKGGDMKGGDMKGSDMKGSDMKDDKK